MYNLNTLRQKEFPLSENSVYLNHASVSPIPTRTKEKMIWATEQLAANPSRLFAEHGRTLMETLPRQIAKFINARRGREIAVITSTSMGINMLAQAIQWQPGDNVVFCEVEFPSNAYPWMSLERDGVEVRQVTAVNGGLTLDALRPHVDQNTRLVAASAIQFLSGHCTDLHAIGHFCHENGVMFFVDAIQAIGHIPIDVQALHIDALITGGQKSLLAPPGIGFMYVREAIAEQMLPRIIGPNATQDWLHWLNYDLTFLPAAGRFGGGTPNLAGIFAMQASLTLLKELGRTNIDSHTTALARYAHKELTARGREVITPCDNIGPIVTFKTELSDKDTDALVQHLAQHDISVVKHLDAPGIPHVRLSFHCYNTTAEIDRFLSVFDDWKA